MSAPNFPFHERIAVEARSMSRARQLSVYFERIRAANLAEEEELRAYIEEARQRIVEIDLYLFELGQQAKDGVREEESNAKKMNEFN
ncbi:hypothetical protein CTI12_AA091960 [Artemisia annua]|uniref:Uncharacterized protein n=1 Tax=Artemisia annua TaxID=35608 RepID=A0A2U1NIP8_ARTAN|nr:hypothetical protein CTI12_AA091960 [Artemisia annua]